LDDAHGALAGRLDLSQTVPHGFLAGREQGIGRLILEG